MSKHIVFVINSLHSRSGSERVACLLANMFVLNLEYKVTILNRSTEISEVAYILNEHIEVKRIQGNPLVFLKGVQSFIDAEKPNSIIVHNMGKLSLLFSFLRKNSSQLISLEHGAFVSRNFFVKFLTHILYTKIDKIVVLNEVDKLEFSRKHKSVVKIYNPSPFDSSRTLKYDENRKTVIALGRLHTEKNFEHLITSWSLLGRKTEGWNLKIYGKGEEYKKLSNLIVSRNANNIKLMGEIEDVNLAYDEAALYAMTSKSEGLPMVLIEAQASGIPIISYDCPNGPREIINNNVDGILVKNQNIEAFSQALLKLLTSFELRKDFSHEALKSSSRFSNGTILTEWNIIL